MPNDAGAKECESGLGCAEGGVYGGGAECGLWGTGEEEVRCVREGDGGGRAVGGGEGAKGGCDGDGTKGKAAKEERVLQDQVGEWTVCEA